MKQFFWLVQQCVRHDRDRYRDDNEVDRVMFYGTQDAAYAEIAKRNLLHLEYAIDRENRKIEEVKQKLVDIENVIRVRNTLTPEQQSLIKVDENGRNTALMSISFHDSKISKMRQKWEPHIDHDMYWEVEDFSMAASNFEWTYDDEDNVVGFKEI